MFRRVLIANRGEIACRVIRTVRRMGMESIAIFSTADRDALHVHLADEAWAVGPSPATESYLAIDRVLDVARRSGAEAVHPGYGFLSESADFAERCRDSGFVFVGPPPEAMRRLGDKAAAKRLVTRIGVPTLDGFHGEAQDQATFRKAAEQIGFPLVVKAVAGGGGRGLRIVRGAAELAVAMESARREALLSFGDDRLLMEKYLELPRHVEVQIIADAFGNVATVSERDCSLQRNHQKLIEETPAPNLSCDVGRALHDASVEVARAAGYENAGTVEFLVKDGAFYFLEVNARLQVEHPVTEMVSGLDLVEWQFRIAAGEQLSLERPHLKICGSSIEARICAEDPALNFLPSTGAITHLSFPEGSPNLRIESGVQQGDRISPYYDSLLAKLVVWDDERQGAIGRLQQALDRTEIAGVVTNLDFLRRLVRDPTFVSGHANTRRIDAIGKEDAPLDEESERWLFGAVAATWRKDATAELASMQRVATHPSPWSQADGWRLVGDYETELTFLFDGKTLTGRLGLLDPRRFWFNTGSGRSIASASFMDQTLRLLIDGECRRFSVVRRSDGYVVIHKGRNLLIKWADRVSASPHGAASGKSLVAPMPARVTRIFVKGGDRVVKGSPLLTLEAMKLEIALDARHDGVVEKVLCREGQSVQEGDKLVAMAQST